MKKDISKVLQEIKNEISDGKPISLSAAFADTDIEKVDLSGYDLSQCYNISYLFCNCEKLRTIDLGDNSFPLLNDCTYWLSPTVEILDISGWTRSLCSPILKWCDRGFLTATDVRNLKHLFVNNEEQKAEAIDILGLKETQVHVKNNDPEYLYSAKLKKGVKYELSDNVSKRNRSLHAAAT